MTKDEALKLALEFIENSECGTADLEARIKEALALPQHTWVGLTDEDWDEIFGNALTICEAIKVTEAKLKQKNGYAEENT